MGVGENTTAVVPVSYRERRCIYLSLYVPFCGKGFPANCMGSICANFADKESFKINTLRTNIPWEST